MGSLFLAVACGSSGDASSSDSASTSFGVGGSAGSVSLAGGSAGVMAGAGGAPATGTGGIGARAGSGGGAGLTTGAGGGVGGGGGGVCPPTQAPHPPVCGTGQDDACTSCICASSDCKARWNACAGDDSCARALGCVLASCAPTLCAAIAGDGQSKLVSLLGCLTGSCAASCKVEPATGAGGSGGHGGGAAGSGGGSAGGHGGSGGGLTGAGGATTTGGGAGAGGSGTGGSGGTGQGGAATAGAGGSATLTCESTACDHELCANGGPLGSACSTCAFAVCQKDGYCCDTHGYWDDVCVAQAADLCGCACGAGGAGGSTGGAGGSVGAGGGPSIACDVPTQAPSSGACAKVDPNGAVECNPVTGAPCDVASGAVCDASYVGGALAGFHCYGGNNTRAICQTCSLGEGFCAVGLTCTTQGCGKLCCDAGDCGSNGTCDKSLGGFDVGVCVGG